MASPDADGWEYRHVEYASPLASRVGRLAAAAHDLQDVGEALDILIEDTDALGPLGRSAYWTFAVTRYGRLFVSGRRHNVVSAALARVLKAAPPQARAIHLDVLALRHKHAAHVDSDLDDEGALIEVRIRNGNELQRRVVGYAGGGVAPRGPILDNFRVLVAKLIEATGEDYARAHARLTEEVNAIPVERLALAPASSKLEQTSRPWGDHRLFDRDAE